MHQINELYYLKSHFSKNLPLLRFSGFMNLTDSDLLLKSTDDQLKSIESIYLLLDGTRDIRRHRCILMTLDEAFNAIAEFSVIPELTEVSTLLYIQKIQNLEIGLFPVLQILVAATADIELMSLLDTCFLHAKAGRSLFLNSISDYLIMN